MFLNPEYSLFYSENQKTLEFEDNFKIQVLTLIWFDKLFNKLK